ncbi:outer membrane lipoprotein LolB [Oxalobacteraceae bacterium GrIS 2.11]
MRRIIVTICLLGLMSACTSIKQPSTSQSMASRTYQTHIDMAGRLSAQYEANYREQSISVHFNWSQTPEQILISLDSPTGQTVATILINADGARLTEADKPPRFASDINQLSTEVLGWPLPVAGLRDWLQGYLNAEHATQITKANSDQTFAVEGWQLRYVSWETEANFERPRRLDMSRQTEQAGQVSLRIVVDSWNTP